MKHITILAIFLLASCGTEMTVHHEIDPIAVEPAIDEPVPEPVPEVAEVEKLTEGVYELVDWRMTYYGMTFDAEAAMNHLPFSSYSGELLVADGLAEFTFTGLIGATVIEVRTDAWEYSGVEFTEDGITQIYNRSEQLQITDETRSSVDKMWYQFQLVTADG